MTKSAYIYFRLVEDVDIQDYVKVQISSAQLVIFDVRSIEFVKFLTDKVAQFDGVLPTNFMLNIPATLPDVKLNSYDQIEQTFSQSVVKFAPLCLEYFRKSFVRVESSSFDCPDILVLLGHFMSHRQRQLCGIEYDL